MKTRSFSSSSWSSNSQIIGLQSWHMYCCFVTNNATVCGFKAMDFVWLSLLDVWQLRLDNFRGPSRLYLFRGSYHYSTWAEASKTWLRVSSSVSYVKCPCPGNYGTKTVIRDISCTKNLSRDACIPKTWHNTTFCRFQAMDFWTSGSFVFRTFEDLQDSISTIQDWSPWLLLRREKLTHSWIAALKGDIDIASLLVSVGVFCHLFARIAHCT